ncbi:MAG: hypothetical protein J4F34_09470, partial [Gemmatimonadetes bacterium]|nr:hypothetical protein [Gemmatimonadota bacterium]
MTPRTLAEARTANEAARAAADADPVAMAERLAALPWLGERLTEWPDPWAGRTETDDPAWRASTARDCLWQLSPECRTMLAERVRLDPDSLEALRTFAAGRLIDALASLPEAPESTTARSLLAAAVERLPPVVRAETRPDPLLPVVQSIREAPERTAGRLAFGGLVEGREPMDGQLPLLPGPDGPRVLLLEVSDVRGGPIMAKGRGAPLDQRLFVRSALWTPHSSRSARVTIAVKVRQLRDHIYPNGWHRGRDWPRIVEALKRARDHMLPGRFEWAGHNVDGWLPFRLAGGIGEGAALDDVVL